MASSLAKAAAAAAAPRRRGSSSRASSAAITASSAESPGARANICAGAAKPRTAVLEDESAKLEDGVLETAMAVSARSMVVSAGVGEGGGVPAKALATRTAAATVARREGWARSASLALMNAEKCL